jgi:cobalt/nickel transport system permease protein
MHISDGILSAPVWIGGYVATAGIVTLNLKKMDLEEMPRVAMITSVFFIASLIHIPLGPTSVHLILNGLVGIVLGPMAFPAILLGITLQTLLFQHGGITTIGVNAIMMGLPAIGAAHIFQLRKKVKLYSSDALFGFLAGSTAIIGATIILALLLVTTGAEFIGVAEYAVLAHIPVMVIEGIMTGMIASFLARVKPEILEVGIK